MSIILHTRMVHYNDKIKKLARVYKKRILASTFSDLAEMLGVEDPGESYWDKQEREKKQQREKNQVILDKVKVWIEGFGYSGEGPLDEDDEERILDYDPKYHKDTKRLSLLFKLDYGVILNLDAQVDMASGDVLPKNVRIVSRDETLPKDMQNRINSATNVPISFYAPDKCWIYDAELDGNMEPGDQRMIDITEKVVKSDKKED